MKPELLSKSIQINSDKECCILTGVRRHLAGLAAGTHPSICWQHLPKGIPFNRPSPPSKKGLQRGRGTLQTGVPLAGICNTVLLFQAILQPFLAQLWRGLGHREEHQWSSVSLQEHLALPRLMEDGTDHQQHQGVPLELLPVPLQAAQHRGWAGGLMVSMAQELPGAVLAGTSH